MCLLGLLLVISLGQIQPVAAQWQRLSLDGIWQFKLASDADAAQRYQRFYEEGYDTSSWDRIKVPSNWAILGFEQPSWVDGSEAEGFYVSVFTAPPEAREQRALLHFDSVWVCAEVWLNGQAIGRHDSGFTPFAIDVTELIRPGGQNRLAVRVRQQIPALQFKFDTNDDWALAGIYHSVWLEFMPRHLYISSVEVETDLDQAYRDAQLRARVLVSRNEPENYFHLSDPFVVRATLKDPNGSEIITRSVETRIRGGHNGNDVTTTLPVNCPRLWTAETPYLYQLDIELIRDGKVVHAWSDQVGFREVSTAGGILRINGRPVKLRGVARHDEHPDVGRATCYEHWLEDIRLMKAANINAVRTAHYPPAEGFIRLCDQMGLYVIEEIPLGYGGDRMDNPIFAAGMLLRIQETIQRDRNRPSVIIWSFGNEDPFTPLHRDGLRIIKGLDCTRPVLMPFRAELDLPSEVDILAPHYWLAVDNDRLVAASDRPVIATEYTHALGPDDFGELKQRWQSIVRHPSGAGAMIWLWADQGLRRPKDGRPIYDPLKDMDRYTRKGSELVRHSDAGQGYIYDTHGHWGADGIVDCNRSPQRDYWEVKAVYAPIRVLQERIPFVCGQGSVFIEVSNDYDFLDLSFARLQWRLYSDADLIQAGTMSVSAPPHTTATIQIPTDRIDPAARPATYYLHLIWTRPDGSEITTHSVRFGLDSAPQPKGRMNVSPTLSEDGDRLTVCVGPIKYVFDRSSGQLARILLGEKPFMGRSRPVVWRPAGYCQALRYYAQGKRYDWDLYLTDCPVVVKDWQVRSINTAVDIYADVEYQHDPNNKIQCELTYRIAQDGELQVEFDLRPQLDVPDLPEIGLEFRLFSSVRRLLWLGDGPLDSAPGKDAATYFGWWNFAADQPYAAGTKWDIEWARLVFEDNVVLHVRDCQAVRLEKDRFRVLTHLAAPWTKNGPPETPQWRLSGGKDSVSHGSFKIVPLFPDDQ